MKFKNMTMHKRNFTKKLQTKIFEWLKQKYLSHEKLVQTETEKLEDYREKRSDKLRKNDQNFKAEQIFNPASKTKEKVKKDN